MRKVKTAKFEAALPKNNLLSFLRLSCFSVSARPHDEPLLILFVLRLDRKTRKDICSVCVRIFQHLGEGFLWRLIQLTLRKSGKH